MVMTSALLSESTQSGKVPEDEAGQSYPYRGGRRWGGPRGGAAGAETQEGSQRGEGKVPEPEDPGAQGMFPAWNAAEREERGSGVATGFRSREVARGVNGAGFCGVERAAPRWETWDWGRLDREQRRLFQILAEN